MGLTSYAVGHTFCVKPPRMTPRIAILGIWGDTWLTRGKYGIYLAIRGSYGALMGSTWRLLEILPCKISTFYCRCLLCDGNEDTLISAA